MIEVYGRRKPGMKYADLHTHSNVSSDTKIFGCKPEKIPKLALKSRLNTVAITDHHEIRGAEIAREYAAKHNLPIDVVVGIEVSTPQGHVVGLYVEHSMGRAKSIEEAIYKIREQGGIVIIPHPFLRPALGNTPLGIKEHVLVDLLNSKDPKLKPDGFEVYSESVEDYVILRGGKVKDTNILALAFYQKHKAQLGAAISVSDSHGFTIGNARTGYIKNLKEEIEKGTTTAFIPKEYEIFKDI